MKTYSTVKPAGIHVLIACLLACLLSFSASVSNVNAANVCSDIEGDCNYSETFNVKTGSGWLNNQSLKLTQTKGVYKYELMTLTSSQESEIKQYAIYYVTVVDNDTGKVLYDRVEWKSGSLKVKLGKNSSYDITVVPETNPAIYACDRYACFKAGTGWTVDSTWRVSRTKHCTFCEYD